MQKITTSLNKTDLFITKKRFEKQENLQPGIATLQKIMQFASSYRVEKIADNQFVELFLN
jgi:hypothetical protein